MCWGSARRSAAFQKLAVLGAGVLAGLLLLEGALRALVGAPVHWRLPQEEYERDERLGHRLRGGQLAFTHDEPVATSSLGIRDREYLSGPEPGVRRILALGDSQTFGTGLALQETWPKQLESALARAAPRIDWQVVNAGVSATDTWQHELMMGELLPRLKPHYAILAFYVNDVAARTQGPVFPLDAQSHWSRRTAYLIKRSALATAILQARDPLRGLLGARPASHRIEANILSGEPDAAVERGWEQVRSSLAAMRDLARGEAIGFAVLVIPRRDQVAGQIDGTAYNRRIAQIAASLGVRSVDALEPLRAEFRKRGRELFIAWDGHNSAVANAVLARTLLDDLRAELEGAR
jgi:lysophospholipase L1-like esterase